MAVAAAPPLAADIARRLAAYLRAIAWALPGSFRRHAWLVLAVLVYFAAGLGIGAYLGAPWSTSIELYLSTYAVIVPLMTLVLLAAHALYIVVGLRPKRPLTLFLRDLRSDLATPERLANALPPLLFLLLFGGTFTLLKAAIPELHPFTWDPVFERWDRWLHGGVAPWELLQPILGAPVVTSAVSWGYNLWFFFLSLTWVWQCFSLRNPGLRMQFFYTVVASWILLGNIAAIFFASAGPCYFGRVTGLPDPFLPLMTYLADADRSFRVWAIGAQEILWSNFRHRQLSLGAGISAMPSMHLAMATVFALVGWRTARWLGIGMTAFFVLILVGSVHLGWHYAIDGYAGALGAIAIWWVAGRLVRITLPAADAGRPAAAKLGAVAGG